MRNWTQRALAGAVPALFAGVICFRLATGPWGPAAPPLRSVEVCGPDRASVERLETKARVAREVIAGRLSLLAAAAAFKALDAEGSPYPPLAVADRPRAGSEDEGYCRKVIAWVRVQAPEDKADDVAGPLEAELDARLRDGALRLAEP